MVNTPESENSVKEKTLYLDSTKLTIGFFIVFVLSLSGGIWWLATISSNSGNTTSKPAESQLSAIGGVDAPPKGRVAGVTTQGPFGPITPQGSSNASPSASPAPTVKPTVTPTPTTTPTSTPAVTPNPSPSASPTATPLPSDSPTASPSASLAS